MNNEMEEIKKKFFEKSAELFGNVHSASAFNKELWQTIESAIDTALEKQREENESYFDSLDYLTDEAISLAATFQQRLNQGPFEKKELVWRANKLVSITRKIRNKYVSNLTPHKDA